MPDPPPSVYLDEDVSVIVAAILQGRGFDSLTTRDVGQLGQPDSQQLTFAATNGRVLLTHNRVDFERLHREWLEAARSHAGIIVARRRSPAEVASRVGRILTRMTSDHLKDQLLYV
jgi:hypothetical protein